MQELTTPQYDLTLISSMGATASTNFIGWCARRLETNCQYNSEGLPAPGPGANPKGLKHRISPPSSDDPYVPRGAIIKRAVFIFDSPYNIIPSLFNRRIAHGHAIAITGKNPGHNNDIGRFADQNNDSFGFHEQFFNWTVASTSYSRLIVRFDAIWDFVPEILEFLEIGMDQKAYFLPDRRVQRKSSLRDISCGQRRAIKSIYADLHTRIMEYPDLNLIPATP